MSAAIAHEAVKSVKPAFQPDASTITPISAFAVKVPPRYPNRPVNPAAVPAAFFRNKVKCLKTNQHNWTVNEESDRDQ